MAAGQGRWSGRGTCQGTVSGEGALRRGLRLAGREMEQKHGVTLGNLPGVQAGEGLPG